MIPVDFFGCKRDEIAIGSLAEACDRFPCTGITLPDASAFTSLSEALTGGGKTFCAELLPSSIEPFRELGADLQAALRKATAEEMKDAGARWAGLPPWNALDTNPMDLAGFLLHLQSLVRGPDRQENSIFLLIEPGSMSCFDDRIDAT